MNFLCQILKFANLTIRKFKIQARIPNPNLKLKTTFRRISNPDLKNWRKSRIPNPESESLFNSRPNPNPESESKNLKKLRISSIIAFLCLKILNPHNLGFVFEVVLLAKLRNNQPMQKTV